MLGWQLIQTPAFVANKLQGKTHAAYPRQFSTNLLGLYLKTLSTLKAKEAGLEKELEVFYCICPRCARAVPLGSSERYCLNDGERLLEACPRCHARFTSPYTRFCGICGYELRTNRLEVPGGNV